MDRILYLFLFHNSRSYDPREVLFYFVPVTIRYAFLQTSSTLTHTGNPCLYVLLFWFQLVPSLSHIRLCLFSFFFFVRLLFYLHLGNLQLVDVFLPLILFISNPSCICTDIAFSIFRAVVAATRRFRGITMWG